mgnify:CR=1 FL=1
MRKVVFFSFILLGGCAGYVWGLRDDWPTRLVMMGVCVLFSGAVGAALASIGKAARSEPWEGPHIIKLRAGSGVRSEALVANYWRDEGYPAFNKPTEYEHVSGKKT